MACAHCLATGGERSAGSVVFFAGTVSIAQNAGAIFPQDSCSGADGNSSGHRRAVDWSSAMKWNTLSNELRIT